MCSCWICTWGLVPFIRPELKHPSLDSFTFRRGQSECRKASLQLQTYVCFSCLLNRVKQVLMVKAREQRPGLGRSKQSLARPKDRPISSNYSCKHIFLSQRRPFGCSTQRSCAERCLLSLPETGMVALLATLPVEPLGSPAQKGVFYISDSYYDYSAG